MTDDLAGMIERLPTLATLIEAAGINSSARMVRDIRSAATALETLIRERDEARAEAKEAHRVGYESAADAERTRTQLTATQARLEEAVNILRASVWTEPTFHYQRHWFQRGRDFCAEYDAQQEGQSNG